MNEALIGSCHCGAVSVQVPGDSVGVVACHCSDCQKLHGNFFAMLAVDRSSIVWSGEDAVRWYDSSATARRAFCSHCGSRLAKDAPGSKKILVSVGLFDRELERRVIKHLFVESKPTWYDVATAQ